eukprot:26354-Eustigmatos_ZCMA.PRE.1
MDRRNNLATKKDNARYHCRSDASPDTLSYFQYGGLVTHLVLRSAHIAALHTVDVQDEHDKED